MAHIKIRPKNKLPHRGAFWAKSNKIFSQMQQQISHHIKMEEKKSHHNRSIDRRSKHRMALKKGPIEGPTGHRKPKNTGAKASF